MDKMSDEITLFKRRRPKISDSFDEIVDNITKGYILLTDTMKYRSVPFSLEQLIQLEEDGLLYSLRSIGDNTYIKKLGDVEQVFNVKLPESDPVKIHPEQEKIVNVEELADYYAEQEYIEKYGSDTIDSKIFKELVKKHNQIITKFKVVSQE